MTDLPFDQRPLVVALAGPNGAGKTTFFHAHLQPAGLRFVNADVLARELDLDSYVAAKTADALRRELVNQRESFVFETVFSDPVGDKRAFLKEAITAGYTVVLCFIGISSPKTSEQRVAMRVSQGGHDVPMDKLRSRYPRTLANLKSAIHELPHVLIFDDDDLRTPFRRVAVFEDGQLSFRQNPLPRWLTKLLK
ncbi:MAG: zeta toxin family protein [Planctomycetia bacterium]|nr:zeta toxin family protein [Planctomycetia bacterium]